MSRKPVLMTKLDEAALKLLGRHFADLKEGEAQPDATEQTKAFQAVVAYFGPRTKLGGDEDTKESTFEQLRSGLHGRRAPGGRSRRSQTNGSGNGAAEPDPDAASST